MNHIEASDHHRTPPAECAPNDFAGRGRNVVSSWHIYNPAFGNIGLKLLKSVKSAAVLQIASQFLAIKRAL